MPETKEWTLMFYFASDNPLAPGIISQLKALKAAGFHKQANVIAQFDPYTEGTPTHIFDINIIKKLESPEDFNIGFDSEDPFIRNLVEDKLWRDERDRDGALIRDRVKQETGKGYVAGVPRSGTIETNGHRYELSPSQSLEEFLRFCSSRYPARHYMLFILGHGVAVGNDLFLFDEHAEEQTLSLTGLRRVLENFTLDIRSHDGSFELVSFHSCSVSSLEVAYELKDTAKYMLASQGATFVGSWPYREILLRIFKDLKLNKNKLDNGEIRKMLTKIYSYCLHNSTDFLLAGYPFDLCLSDLTKIGEVKPLLSNLTKALMKGLQDCSCRESILLAHLESQSFYGEMYTDIIDFCRCLFMRMKRAPAHPAAVVSNGPVEVETTALSVIHAAAPDVTSGNVPAVIGNETIVVEDSFAEHCDELPGPNVMEEIQTACAEVVRAIRETIVKRGFAGPEYQYSRGLSIYFPWSRPSADSGVLANYARYQLAANPEPKDGEPRLSTWLDFLNRYFEDTRRKRAIFEEEPQQALMETSPGKLTDKEKLLEDKIAVVYTQAAPSMAPNLPGSLQKTDKTDPMGGDCVCPSIKNYPRDTRPRRQRKHPSDESLGFAPALLRQEA